MTIIIPALPNEIAWQILLRIPRALHGSFRRVSRAWSAALHPNNGASINAHRKKLHISEAWLLFLTLQGDRFCFVFADVAHHRCHKIYRPLPRGAQCSRDHCMAVGSEVLMPPICSRQSLDSEHWLCFDALCMQWKTSISMSTTTAGLFIRSGHASAAMDGYVYAAGGGRTEVLKHADRMEMSTKKWEALPDMWKGRMCPAAVALNGRLCIIGGSEDGVIHKSGEMWDPENRQWTLAPELWPTHMYSKLARRRPTVAVVKDRLYALSDDISGDNLQEIMYYEYGSKLWISLGKVCFRSLCGARNFGAPLGDGVKIEMLAVGHELVVLYHERGSLPWSRTSMVIFSTAPNPPQALSWSAWRLPDVMDNEFEPVIVHV